MHHAGLLFIVLVALVLLGPLMMQGLGAAGPVLAQAGSMMDAVARLVDLSAFAGLLAIIVAGLLAVAILRLIVGF